MSRGRFITIEGAEGVGKSTQLAVVREAVEGSGREVVCTREPGGTPRAERIRQLVLDRDTETMPVSCELLLMFAARATHLENLILPAMSRGAWVICDRFTDATYAYQGGGRGVSYADIARLEQIVQGQFRPDLTLLLDAPVEIALERARRRNGDRPADRFEAERTSFFERVRSAYLDLAHRFPQRIRIIDAGGDVTSVATRVREEVVHYLGSCDG